MGVRSPMKLSGTEALRAYLVELRESDLWAYAIYHCGTAENWYSDLHWGFFPRGHLPRFARGALKDHNVAVSKPRHLTPRPGRL